MDYSSAGYRQGADLPTASALFAPSEFVEVSPGPGDDLARIEAAIAQVASRPIQSHGYRGVVQLTAGEFQISSTLNISISGVILRGVGDGDSPSTSTILRATGTARRNLIDVGISGFHGIPTNTPTAIVDKVVPAGATSLRVVSPQNYAVGESVIVRRNATQAWIDSLGADQFEGGGSEDQPWDPGDSRYDHIQERVIVRKEGNRLFFDAPIAHSIDQRLVTGQILKYGKSRASHIGIENLRGMSDFNNSETGVESGQAVFTDLDHAESFIDFGIARDAWVRNITGQHFSHSTVQVTGSARSITVQDAQSLDPVSPVSGGLRYSFSINGGQFILMQDLYSEQGRHDFINNSTFSGFNRGPNVFLNGTAVNSLSDTGPHQRYSTGVLYDNIISDNEINVRDRHTFGSSHGWAGANQVVWNSVASSFLVQNPPGARNYLIGSNGTIVTNNPINNASDAFGTFDSLGQRVQFNDQDNPQDSLYVAQRLEKQRFADEQSREYWIGDFDQLVFDGTNSDDNPGVDSAWLSAIAAIDATKPIATMDFDAADHRVPFTIEFDLAPNEVVVSAVLTLGMKRFGPHSDDDELYLDDPSAPISFAAAEWGWIDELESFDDGNDVQVLTLELAGDVSYLDDGQLNGLLTDDRALDWAHLIVNVIDRDLLPDNADFDRDGDVDGADFLTWQRGFNSGTTLAAGDADYDGDVDASDLGIWQTQYLAGSGSGSQGLSVAVPEPSTYAMVLLIVLCLGVLRIPPFISYKRREGTACFLLEDIS